MQKHSLAKLLIFTLFLCYSSSGYSTEPLTLPKPTGPYSVGMKAVEVRDPNRTMLRGNGPRRWMVQVFYPSRKHVDTYCYRPGTLKDGMVNGIKVLAWAKLNSDPIPSQKFPVVIFIPGRGGERQQHTILCEELASHGYIVLATEQPYAANFVKFPDGTKIVLTFKDIWKIPRDRDYRYQYDDEVIKGSIHDITYMLENLTSLFGDVCDPDLVILMGHSLGGNVAHILGFQDQRIKAIVDIDSKITERKIFGHVGVPSNLTGKRTLFIRGMMQYQQQVGDQLTKVPNSTVWSPMVEHSAFSDNAYLTARLQGFGKQGFIANLVNWLFKQGPYLDDTDTNLGGQNADDWFTAYRRKVITWLKGQVKYSDPS